MNPKKQSKKIAIIGAGGLGSATAFTLTIKGIASEIVLIDIDRDKAEGEAMDIKHGSSFVPPVTVEAGSYPDCQNADVIIITAGSKQKQGESRLDLVNQNTEIFKMYV